MDSGVDDVPNPARLLDRVRDKIRLRHYSIRTEQAYVDWIKRFILHHGKRYAEDLGAMEVGQGGLRADLFACFCS